MSAARSRRANDKHNHLQRTPILVMGCSLLIACCIAFGGTNWTASAQPSEDQLPEENAIVEPGYYQETIGSYEAISQSDDNERAILFVSIGSSFLKKYENSIVKEVRSLYR